jgi:hypothetical protein
VSDEQTADALCIAIENVELRAQLAEAQDQCIELAVGAGELQVEIDRLRVRLAVVERDRSRCQHAVPAECRDRRGVHLGDRHSADLNLCAP